MQMRYNEYVILYDAFSRLWATTLSLHCTLAPVDIFPEETFNETVAFQD